MFCSKCGSGILQSDNFCTSCGAKILDSDNLKSSINVDQNQTTIAKSKSTLNSFIESNDGDISPYGFPERKRIVKTYIVANDSRKSATSSIIRGAIGGAIIGPVGLLGGAISGKNKKTTTFLVVYNTGEKRTETVKTNGLVFREYVKYLD